MPPRHDGGAADGAARDARGSAGGALLRVRGLVKRFAAATALAGVDFRADAGEVHAVLGENGAGKSTLMHVVSGLYAADQGEIAFAGRAVRWRSPEDARAAGIAMVHQHFMLVPTLSVAENLALARGAAGWLSRARLAAEASALAARFRLDVGDPGRRIDDLSVGDRQRVEILKALMAIDRRAPAAAGAAAPVAGEDLGRRLLILDEPTAVLTPDEVGGLFALLRDLARRGAGVIIVTHKLAEVLALADRVTVLRAGRVIATGAAADYGAPALAALMVGAERDAGAAGAAGPGKGEGSAGALELAELEPAASAVRPLAPLASGAATGGVRRAPRAAAPVIVAEGLRARDPRGATVLDGVDLRVAHGEVLVLAGVEGNGQSELVAALAGVAREVLRDVSGRVRIAGREIAGAADARHAGLAVVPADRMREGVVPDLPVWENLLLARGRLARIAPRGIVPRAAAIDAARTAMRDYGVRPADPLLPAGALSGGNQQRLVLARELGGDAPRAVVAANPTRGLDLAATASMRRRLRELAAAGAAVLVLSTDLDEVLDLADRVAVLYRGRLVEPAAQPPSRAAIGRLMAGGAEAA